MAGRIGGKRSRGMWNGAWVYSVKGWLKERGVKHQEVELIESEQGTEHCDMT